MSIACPHCGHRMSLRDPKPGRFQPKCGKCAQRFRLTIADATSPPVVEPLDAAPAAETKSNPPTANAPTPSSKTAVDVAATIDAALDSPSASNAPPQATTGAADATIDHVGSQATKAAPDNNTQDIGATFDAPSAATRADGSPPSPGEANQVHTPTQFATSMAAGASPAAKPTPPAGKHSDRLGGYRILRELGRGAMGTVYLARQLSLDRNVALKTIQAHWANHPNVMARFTREAYAAAQLTHHNVVQIYDLGEDRGTPYFSMEFVRGMSLADLLERAGKLDARTAVGHMLQAARGLRFAHQQGMIHRDIKPANLMLDEHGVVKVADLGLVKAPEMLDLDDEADEPAASSTLASVTA
ncbi:MAG: protein kinase, partial [Planctomycetales bacterium]|nr:protein kinase [Planctomycetales bacterium]